MIGGAAGAGMTLWLWRAGAGMGGGSSCWRPIFTGLTRAVAEGGIPTISPAWCRPVSVTAVGGPALLLAVGHSLVSSCWSS